MVRPTKKRCRIPLSFAARWLLLRALAIVLVAASVHAEEVPLGWSVSSTTTLSQWGDYFNSDLRELGSRAFTMTYYDEQRTKPVRVGEVMLDLRTSSPVYTESAIRTVVRPGDPEAGTIRIESTSTTAEARIIKTRYTLEQKSLDAPIVVGPLEGIEVRPPPHEEVIQGKTFVFRTVSRTVEIAALMVAATFEDLLAGRNIREVREPGTRLEADSLRVVSPNGKPVGYFAGDVRIARGEDFVSVKP